MGDRGRGKRVRPGLEPLEGRTLLAAPPPGSHIGISHRVVAERFAAEVVPLNGSGVAGRGQVVETFHLDGPDSISLQLTLRGLELGHRHPIILTHPSLTALVPITAPAYQITQRYQARGPTLGPLADGAEPLVICGKTVQGRYDSGAPVAVVRLTPLPYGGHRPPMQRSNGGR